jgi:hypothetical protein
MSNYDRIKVQVQASPLAQNEKQLITDMFAEIADEALENIANLFEKSPDWVEKFYENYSMKKKANDTKDTNLWKEIVEQEKKYLAEVTFGLD